MWCFSLVSVSVASRRVSVGMRRVYDCVCVFSEQKNKYLFQLSVSTLNINITLSLSFSFFANFFPLFQGAH